MSSVRYEAVEKRFGLVTVLRELNLDVPDHAFLALLGPSGCGKTTALRLLAGLDLPTAGRILIGERNVTRLQPRDRDIAMVFQSYALYPQMSVLQNIAYPLRIRKVAVDEQLRRVGEVAQALEIDHLLDRRPRALSGGQRQRVALARAIVREPSAFLMDEPLSNLDAKLRVEMRGEIIRVQRRIAAPTLYVTHDQTEAMTMGDRVAILRDGLLQQLGTPDQVYDRPVNAFVAGFIGSPSMNLLPAGLEADGDGCAISVGGARLAAPRLLEQRPALRGYLGKPVTLGIRPEDFGTDGDGGEIDVTVARLESLGSELVAYLAPAGMAADTLLTARLERRAALTEGSATRVNVDVERLYFFDPESGAALT